MGVLISAQGNECTVRITLGGTRLAVVTAILSAVGFDSPEELAKEVGLCPANHRPAPGQCSQMDKVQALTAAEPLQIRADVLRGKWLVNGLMCGKGENCIIKIRPPIPIEAGAGNKLRT